MVKRLKVPKDVYDLWKRSNIADSHIEKTNGLWCIIFKLEDKKTISKYFIRKVKEKEGDSSFEVLIF